MKPNPELSVLIYEQAHYALTMAKEELKKHEPMIADYHISKDWSECKAAWHRARGLWSQQYQTLAKAHAELTYLVLTMKGGDDEEELD